MAALTPELQAKIEAYLLGRLPSEEQPQIEALLFEDDDMFEAIREAEDDLIDRYLADELPPADREAFEHAFATSASRQERIAIARALSQGLASGSPAPDAVPPATVTPVQARRWASGARRFGLPAGAALVAVLAIAIAWRNWLAPSNPGVSPSPDERSVATFPLERIDSLRGAGGLLRLRLPQGTTTLRLQPALEGPSPGAGYVVALRRVEGQVVWQGTARAENGRDRISVSVPVQLVAPGDYVLSLAAPGTPPDDRAEYTFRIVAPD